MSQQRLSTEFKDEAVKLVTERVGREHRHQSPRLDDVSSVVASATFFCDTPENQNPRDSSLPVLPGTCSAALRDERGATSSSSRTVCSAIGNRSGIALQTLELLEEVAAR